MEENIGFSEWQKLDLRVGEIIEIKEIENADKLYELIINLGKEKRTLVAGLKEFYSREQLKNKKVIVFTNLEPKKLRGIESQGMLLAAVSYDEHNNEKSVRLLQPDGEIEVGSRIS